MLKNASRMQLIATWVATLTALFALTVVWGVKPSTGSVELWLFACLAPPAVMLLVWRPPSQTVAEVLYDANHVNTKGRS